jgi:hypothetical protein
MCDGSNEKGGLVLCTDSFTLEDVCTLISLLYYNFGFKCTLREKNLAKGQYRIYIRTESMSKLRKNVLPYMHPFFYPKLKDKNGQI